MRVPAQDMPRILTADNPLLSLPKPALGMLAIRTFFGVNYTPSVTSMPRKAGWPSVQLNPTSRFFQAVFGIREFLMVAGVLDAALVGDSAGRSARLRRALAASAAVDAFDAASASVLAATRPALRRPALLSAVTASASCALAAAAAALVD